MPLEGLRAWVAEVERKLGKRTRVFLALATIAIGIAGAAVYLAIDARESSVSESDLQALQDELEARGTVGAAGASAAQLEAELTELRTRVEQLESGSSGSADSDSDSGKGNDSTSGGGTSTNPGASDDEEASSGAGAATGGAKPEKAVDPAKLGKLLEETQKKNEEAEQEQRDQR